MQSPAAPGGSSPSAFPTTQWSLVLAAGDQGAASGNRALAELCRAYWRPLYTFVRRRGFPEDEARDLTQEFFLLLLERDVVARADRERGRFRTFLLATLRNFLADEHDRRTAQKRGGGARHVSWDELEEDESDVLALPPSATAELCFDAAWARMLAQRALDLVRENYAQRGRANLFGALHGFLTGGDAPSYAAAREQLGLSESAVTSAIHRLRQDYRAALRHLVAQTVRDIADVEDELRYLLSVLSQLPA